MGHDDREQPDVSRRDLGALLGILGGGAALSAIASCASADGSTALPEPLATQVQAATGTSIVWFDIIGTSCANANELISTFGPSNAYQVAIVFGYHAPGDGGGGVFYWDYTSTATPDGGTIFAPGVFNLKGQCNTGTGRWKRIYCGALNIRWFGAVGNAYGPNPTDDAPAIHAALAAAPPPGSTEVGTAIYIPPGNYWLNSADVANVSFFVLQPNNSSAATYTIFGDGPVSRLVVNPNYAGSVGASVFHAPGGGANVVDSSFRNFLIDFQGTQHSGTSQGAGVAIENVAVNVEVDRVHFESCNGITVAFVGGYSTAPTTDPPNAGCSHDIRITNCYFYNMGAGLMSGQDQSVIACGGDGVNVSGNQLFNPSTDTTAITAIEVHGGNICVQNNRALGGFAEFMNIAGSGLSSIQGAVIANNVADSVASGIILWTSAIDVLIVGNKIRISSNSSINASPNCGITCINDFGSSGPELVGCVICDNLIDYAPQPGFALIAPVGISLPRSDSTSPVILIGCTIRGNHIEFFPQYGIYIAPSTLSTTSSADVTVASNVLQSCGETGLYGIYVNTSAPAAYPTVRTSVIDNVITDPNSLLGAGVCLAGNFNDVQIARNKVRGLGSGGIDVNVSGANFSSSGSPVVEIGSLPQQANVTLSAPITNLSAAQSRCTSFVFGGSGTDIGIVEVPGNARQICIFNNTTGLIAVTPVGSPIGVDLPPGTGVTAIYDPTINGYRAC